MRRFSLLFWLFSAIFLVFGSGISYGEAVSGDVVPTITAIELSHPNEQGIQVAIHGLNFASGVDKAKNVISFPRASTLTPLEARSDLLIVQLPQTVRSGGVTVTVDGKSSSPFPFMILAPEIIAVAGEKRFTTGNLLTLFTKNVLSFSTGIDGPKVFWNGVSVPLEAVNPQKKTIDIRLPETSGMGTLSLQSGGLQSDVISITVSASPIHLSSMALLKRQGLKAILSISSSDFSSDPAKNKLTFDTTDVTADMVIDPHAKTMQFSITPMLGVSHYTVSSNLGNALQYALPEPKIFHISDPVWNGTTSISFHVSGEGFSQTTSENMIFFGSSAMSPNSATSSNLFFSTSFLPPLFGQAYVEVNGVRSTSIPYDFRHILAPRIFSISCQGLCAPGAIMTFFGQNLLNMGELFSPPQITLSSGVPWELRNWHSGGGAAKIPVDVPSNSVLKVSITANGQRSNEVVIHVNQDEKAEVLPTLLSLLFPEGAVSGKPVWVRAFETSGPIQSISFEGALASLTRDPSTPLQWVGTIPATAKKTGTAVLHASLSGESNGLPYTLIDPFPNTLGLFSASSTGMIVADGNSTIPLFLQISNTFPDLRPQRFSLHFTCVGSPNACAVLFTSIGKVQVMRNSLPILSGAYDPIQKSVELFGTTLPSTIGREMLPLSFSVAPSLSESVTLQISIGQTILQNGITGRVAGVAIDNSSISLPVVPAGNTKMCQSFGSGGSLICADFLGNVNQKPQRKTTIPSTETPSHGSSAETWYEDAMAWGKANQLIDNGVVFDRLVTRAEFLDRLKKTMRIASTGGSQCIDSQKHPFRVSLETAAAKGWILGKECAPDRLLNRGEAVTILIRAFGKSRVESGANPFVDLSQHWAKGAFLAVRNAGIVNGVDATHAQPNGPLNWAQVLQILHKTQQNWGK